MSDALPELDSLTGLTLEAIDYAYAENGSYRKAAASFGLSIDQLRRAMVRLEGASRSKGRPDHYATADLTLSDRNAVCQAAHAFHDMRNGRYPSRTHQIILGDALSSLWRRIDDAAKDQPQGDTE